MKSGRGGATMAKTRKEVLSMIRAATAADIDAIEAGYNELLLYEQEHGSNSHWVLGVYPTRATAERAVEAGTMYVLDEGGRICASMILNSRQAAEYREMPWLYPAADDEVLVIHTLCVPPSMAGRGLGTRMVDFATGFGLGMSVLRLDTNLYNLPAQRLYLKNGCRIAGNRHCVHEGVLGTDILYLERKL